MVADIAVKEKTPVPDQIGEVIRADNDNVFSHEELLSKKEIDPLTNEAARRLMNAHNDNTPVIIEAWGDPEYVYEQIKSKLLNFGYQIDMAEDMAQRLVDYAVAHAEESRQKHKSNIIGLKIQVSHAKPDPQFETGPVDVQRIDGKSNSAEVFGASAIAMGINTGGTFTTALRDSVGEIMSGFALMGLALYIISEAPDKSELKGVVNAATMAAIADIAAGNLSPADMEALLEKLDMLVAEDIIPQEVANALKDLNELQTQAAEGKLDNIGELSQSIIDSLRDAMAGDNPPPTEILQAMVEAMQLVSDKYGLQSVMNTAELSQFKQDVLKAVVTEKLEAIAENLDGMDQETLQALIDEIAELEGAELHQHLDQIDAQLQELGVEVPEIAELKDLIVQNMPLDQRIEFLAEMQAQNLMDLIAELGGVENLPPEIQELLEGLDVENLTLEDLKEALAGKGDPALVEAVQNFIVQIQNPEIQAMMPEGMAERVTQFLNDNSQLVEAVTTKAVISEMSVALAEMDATSPEAAKIAEAIERLEAGESMEAIDPAIMESVIDKLDGPAAAKMETVVHNIEQKVDAARIIAEVRTDPVLSANPDIMQKIDALDSADVSDFKAALDAAKGSIALADYGSNPVTATPDFSPKAAVQQLSMISENISTSPVQTDSPTQTTPTSTVSSGDLSSPQAPPAEKVTTTNLEAVAQVIDKFTPDPATGQPTNPPKINEVIGAVQKLNSEIAKVSPQDAAQLQAIKDKLVQTLPENVQQEQKAELNKSSCPAECPCCGDKNFNPAADRRLADGSMTLDNGNTVKQQNDGTLIFKDKEGNVTQQVSVAEQKAYSEHAKAMVTNHEKNTGIEARQDKIVESFIENKGHICGAGCNHGEAPKITQESINTVTTAIDKMQQSNGGQLTIEEVDFSDFAKNDNIANANNSSSGNTSLSDLIDNNSSDENITELFKGACEGNCGACGKCATETKPKNAPAPQAI